jgi:hypothetical protein
MSYSEQVAGGQLVACGCLLSRFEAAGYVTPDSVRTLVVEAQAERAAGGSGTSERTFLAAIGACRR